jgi:hypothetical protein
MEAICQVLASILAFFAFAGICMPFYEKCFQNAREKLPEMIRV